MLRERTAESDNLRAMLSDIFQNEGMVHENALWGEVFVECAAITGPGPLQQDRKWPGKSFVLNLESRLQSSSESRILLTIRS